MNISVKEPRCILAPNPSPLTGPGTNTFLIGSEQVAVIDPGPDDPSHLDAIMSAGKGNISHILVTHTHLDHSAGATALARRTGAPVLAFGDALAGRSATMRKLAAEGVGGNEGLDMAFRPDMTLTDGQTVETPEWSLRAIHTPGHCANHLSFQWHDMLFCGDIVMAWSSTLISPPDGDLADYFRSLEKIQSLDLARLLPAHGPAIDNVSARLSDLGTHRRLRTAQIMNALRECPDSAEGIARRIYDVPQELLGAATRNVLAHLLALAELGAVTGTPEPAAIAKFSSL